MKVQAIKPGQYCAGPRHGTSQMPPDTTPCTLCTRTTYGLSVALLGLVLLGVASTEAQQPAGDRGQPPRTPVIDLPLAATVDGVPVYVAEVEQRVRQSLGGRDITPPARVLLQAEALQQLTDRQLALSSLEKRGEAANEQEVDLEIQRLKDDLARQEKSLDDYLRSQEIQEPILRQQLLWQLSWKRCLARYLTDENLQRYFDRHRREFDGTTLRVAQVLLKREQTEHPDAAESERLLARARQIREEIVSGKITFADAARKYSQSPSGLSGGELDWIGRDGPMPDLFTRAAFALEAAQISEPIASPYGVHLIQCLEVKPGNRTWQDARDELTNAASQYLFRWLVERRGAQQNIQFTNAVPHFQAGIKQLVVPASPQSDRTTTENEQAGK